MSENVSLSNTAPLPCTLPAMFLVWLQIGTTSFGGGAVTQYLIQEHFIYRRQWITHEDFRQILAVSQICPGINLLAYTILIGKKLGGIRGSLLSLLGFLLPCTAITIALSAIYAKISDLPLVQHALQTMFAAIFGISLATNWRNIRPIFQRQTKKTARLYILAVMLGSAILYEIFDLSVIALYLFGACSLAVLYRGKKAGKGHAK